MNTELAVKEMNRDQIELLVIVYRQEFERSFPQIDILYKVYRYLWEEESIEYLYANKDAFKLEEIDFENIDENLEDFGFKVPSFEDIHRWLDVMQLMYMTENNEVVHSPLVNVW